MHLCKCSLIFFLHHIYTAQTVKLPNVLISTPTAVKLFETFRRCEKSGTQIKPAVARCWQRGRGVWSAPIVFVLGWGPAVGRPERAERRIPQPLHTARSPEPQRGQRSLGGRCIPRDASGEPALPSASSGMLQSQAQGLLEPGPARGLLSPVEAGVGKVSLPTFSVIPQWGY